MKAKITMVSSAVFGDFWVRLRGANGEIFAHTESYSTKSNAKRAARRLYALMNHDLVGLALPKPKRRSKG